MKGVQAPKEVHGAKSSIFEESGTRQILSLGFGLLLLGHWFQTSATPAKHSQWNLLFSSITPLTVSSRISTTMLSFIA